MYKNHCDEILEGDNVIIGLGDSFTQGVGAYSNETWASMPRDHSSYNISGQLYTDEQSKNNWVRKLSQLLGYKVCNMGVNGAGNRAAVREMFLNKLPDKLGNVIVILMATGIERFDFIKQSDETAGVDWHQKWQTIWPALSDRGPISKIEKEYLEQIWSRRNDALEFLFNVNDAKNFCERKGYKFLFCSAFDSKINKRDLMKDLDRKKEHIDLIDWDDFISTGPYESLMDMLNQAEGNKHCSMHEIFSQRIPTSKPSQYITPCSHWSIEGQAKVAEFLFDEIKKRNLA